MGEKGGGENCAGVPEENVLTGIRRIPSQVQGKETKASSWNSGSQWGGRGWVGQREEGDGGRAPLASNKKGLTYLLDPDNFHTRSTSYKMLPLTYPHWYKFTNENHAYPQPNVPI